MVTTSHSVETGSAIWNWFRRPHIVMVAVVVGLEIVVYAVLRRAGLLSMWVAAFAMIAIAVQVANLGLSIIRRVRPCRPDGDDDNAVINAAFATVGGVYALLLGFIIVVTWQNFSETETVVGGEANAIADLERMSRGFAVETQRQVQGAARAYLRLVVDEEWAAMPNGLSSERANAAMVELWGVYTDMELAERGSPLYSQSIGRLNELGDGRRARLVASKDSIPPLMWALLYSGAAITVFMSFLFRVHSPPLQRVLISFLVCVMVFALFLVEALQSPFDAELPVTPEPFEQVLSNMRQLEL